MTQDEIIRMAREVWGERAVLPFNELERFAALVVQNYMAKACGGCVIKQCYKRMDVEIEAAVKAEREACAKMCEEYADKCVEAENWEAEDVSLHCAAAIRARGETK